MMLLQVMMVFFLVGLVYLLFTFMFYKEWLETETVSVYECGFEPKSSSRVYFSNRFFLITILFIIFDVEISLMLPIPFLGWSMWGSWVFFVFILVLVLGIIYEYFCGALKWLN